METFQLGMNTRLEIPSEHGSESHASRPFRLVPLLRLARELCHAAHRSCGLQRYFQGGSTRQDRRGGGPRGGQGCPSGAVHGKGHPSGHKPRNRQAAETLAGDISRAITTGKAVFSTSHPPRQPPHPRRHCQGTGTRCGLPHLDRPAWKRRPAGLPSMAVHADGVSHMLLRRCNGWGQNHGVSQRQHLSQLLLQLMQPGRGDHGVSQFVIRHAAPERQPSIDRYHHQPRRLACGHHAIEDVAQLGNVGVRLSWHPAHPFASRRGADDARHVRCGDQKNASLMKHL